MGRYELNLRRGEVDWSTVPRTQDGNFACRSCGGGGQIHLAAWKNLPEVTRTCVTCRGTGYLAEELLLALGCEQGQSAQYKSHRDVLLVWIKSNSTCKTCHGDQYKTLGGTPCKECGLEGMQPWGG